jgi:hypothetical protein
MIYTVLYILGMIVSTTCYFLLLDTLDNNTIGEVISVFILSSLWPLLWVTLVVIKITELDFWKIVIIRRKKPTHRSSQ